MKQISIVLISMLHLYSLVSGKPGAFHHTDFQDRVYPAPIPNEYVEIFRKFSLKNTLSPSFNIEQPDKLTARAVQSSPASLAYLYSVVNEKVFGIETRDLLTALDVPSEQVSKVFSAVVDNLMQDREMVLTSGIFTKNENLSATSGGLADLHSYVKVIPLGDNPKAVEEINNYVSNHTENLITDQLLPADSPFYNSTGSVVVNTAYISNTFNKPLTPIGKKEFRVTPELTQFVDTLEMTSSHLPVYQADQYTAVALKMGEKKRKTLVLIKPKESLGQFMKNDVKDIFGVDFLNKFAKQSSPTRFQFPVLNLTLARSFSSEYENPLKIPSFTSAICDAATDKENLLQKIVQISSIRLSSTSFQVAIVIGVGVDNVKEYRKEFGAGDVNATGSTDDPLAGEKLHKHKITQNGAMSDAVEGQTGPDPQPEVAARAIIPEDQLSSRQAPSAIGEKHVPVHIQVQPMMLPRSDDLPSGHQQRHDDHAVQQQQTNDLIFDSPFFAYLYDEVLGPFEFLAVRSPAPVDPTSTVPVESEDFSEYKKLSRWVCIAPPPPLNN